MENGIVYEGQFVKGQFHGEGKLIYPNVLTFSPRAVTTRRSGSRARWLRVNTSSTIISASKRRDGSTASMTIAGSIRSICMGSSHQELRSRPEKINHTTSPLGLTTPAMGTTSQSKASSIVTMEKSTELPLKKRWSLFWRSADTCPRLWISTAARIGSSRRYWRLRLRSDSHLFDYWDIRGLWLWGDYMMENVIRLIVYASPVFLIIADQVS